MELDDTFNLVLITYLIANTFIGIGNYFSGALNTAMPDIMLQQNYSIVTYNSTEYENATDVFISNPIISSLVYIINPINDTLNGLAVLIRNIMSIVGFPDDFTAMIYLSLSGLTGLMYSILLIKIYSAVVT